MPPKGGTQNGGLLIQRKVRDQGGHDQPKQAFDQKEHKAGETETLYPRFGLPRVLLHLFVHIIKIQSVWVYFNQLKH